MNPSQRPNPRTDWFIWSLHLLLGLFLGALAGAFLGARMVRLHLIDIEGIGHVITAVSLIGGAITSFKGNRAWFTHSVFDADEPLRSPASRSVSIVMGTAGALIAARIVCLHLMAAPRSSHHHLNSPLSLPVLMIAALLTFIVIHAIKTGTVLGPGFTIDREESPFVFWIYVVMNALSLIAGVRLVLW